METAVGRGTQRPPEVWEQKHRLRSVCLTHHISLYEWLLPEVNIKTIRSCAAFSMTVAWHTSLTRWTAESFLESKGQRLLKHKFGSCGEMHSVRFRVLWMKNCTQITIKGEHLSKQMTGELPMNSVWKNCLKPPPLKKAYNSPVHPPPRDIQWQSSGARPERGQKAWGRSASGFHSNPTLPWQLSPRGNTFLVKPWCDCWWWWLYQCWRVIVLCMTPNLLIKTQLNSEPLPCKHKLL